MVEAWMSMRLSPPLGWGPSAVIIAAAVGSMGWLYLRHDRRATGPMRRLALILMRGVALAGLAGLLLCPEKQAVNHTGQDKTQPIAVRLLVDTSASMAQRDGLDRAATPPRPGDATTGESSSWTRWQTVRQHWLTDAFAQRLAQKTPDVQVFGFDQAVRRLSLHEARQQQPTGDETDLFGALGRVLAGEQGGVAVVLSDGHDTGRVMNEAVVTQAADAGWKVLGVPVGAPGRWPDLAVAAWPQSDVLAQGQSTVIHAVVSQSGLPGRRAVVQLWQGDRVVRQREVRFDGQGLARWAIPITPASQPSQAVTLHAYRVRARLVASPGDAGGAGGVPSPPWGPEEELYLENNQRWVFVQVSRQRIKVALFEGQPYWDTTFLSRALREDAHVDLTTIHSLGAGRAFTVHRPDELATRGEPPAKAAGRQPRGDPAGDSDGDADRVSRDGGASGGMSGGMSGGGVGELEGYDVIILGRSAQHFFGGEQARRLKDYVLNQGGALVLARGEPFDVTTTPGREAMGHLEPILPVRWGRQTLRALELGLTEAGRADPLTRLDESWRLDDTALARLPGMLAATRVHEEKAASVVLLRQRPRRVEGDAVASGRGQAMAALAYQHAGHGRVMVVLTEGLWRWAFLPGRLRSQDGVYRAFWSRAVRWLAMGDEFLPGQWLSMRCSRLTAQPDQPITVTVGVRPGRGLEPQLEMISPAGQRQRVALARPSEQSSRYVATVQPQEPGVYQLELTADSPRPDSAPPDSAPHPGVSPGFTPTRVAPRVTAGFAVQDRSVERLDPSARPGVLARISRATGGRCLSVDNPGALLEYLDDMTRARGGGVSGGESGGESGGTSGGGGGRFEPIADPPVVLIVMMGLFVFEWLIRRRSGLL